MLDGHPDIRAVALDYYGTLVDVGTGKIPADLLPEIIASRDRERAGHTAPPQGLYMAEVFY